MVAFSVAARILCVFFSVSIGPLVIGLSQTTFFILLEEKFNDTNVKYSITCMLKVRQDFVAIKGKVLWFNRI